MSSSTQVVCVRRDKIATCMTCPLCNKLLKQATTISLCLHTFCRKCIYERFSDDEVDSCPVCDINLGCVPVDKLRPDHNLQDIRAKIFPFKRRKVEAPKVITSPPAKRKERSLSSLVVSTPRVSMQAGITGRRTRAGARKGSVPRDASPSVEGTPKKEESVEDCMEGSSSPETLNKMLQNKKQSFQSSSAKSSSDQTKGENTENNNEGWDGKVDLWKPLNTLVEAANRSKYTKAGLPGPTHTKPDPPGSGDADACVTKVKEEDNGLKTESPDDKKSMPSVSGPTKRKRLRQSKKNATAAPANLNDSEVMQLPARHNWKDRPIWFSLVASADPEGGESLPQVPSAFMRVKEGNMPVSFIQKYIAKKLLLASEEEVQLTCQGQTVPPQLKLTSLLDLWLRSSSTTKIKTAVGDSAKEFVMILSYSRKSASPAS